LWNLKTGRSSKRLPGVRLLSHGALSANGKYVAGLSLNGIEVWSFDKGKLVLSVPADVGTFKQLAFAGLDRLVVLGYQSRNCQLTVWDVSTGQAIHRTDEIPMATGPAMAVSPGGKFLVYGNINSLTLVDLEAGRFLANLKVPDSGRSGRFEGLCFSNDGELLAASLHGGAGTRIVCWKFADGSVVADSSFSKVVDFGGLYQIAIQFLPDKTGWLVGRSYLVPLREGTFAWPKPPEPSQPIRMARIDGARIVDNDHLLLWNVQLLVLLRLPRDASGKPSWADEPVSIESLLASNQALRSNGPTAGISGNHLTTQLPPGASKTPNVSKTPDAAAQNSAVGDKQNTAALREIYKGLIVGDGKELARRMRWYPAGGRPVIGLRWGLGIDQSGRSDAGSVRTLSELAHATGSVGTSLLDLVQQQSTAGKFGDWAKIASALLPDASSGGSLGDVVFLGEGKLADLKTAARRQGLDALVLIEMKSEMNGFTKRRRTTLVAKTVDVDGDRPAWSSESLSSTQIAEGAKSGADPREGFVQKVGSKLAESYVLTEIPALTKEAVKARVEMVARSTVDNPLPLVAELRYYQFKQLAEPADLDSAYDHLLGPGGARKMLEGTVAEKQEAVDSLFKGDAN
jgi:hypothetical protein